MIRPNVLFVGARVALLAPSGTVRKERIDLAIEGVRKLGLVPVVYKSCHAKHGYLAGDDKLRAGDLNAAFADPSINGILCMRGGYGANRILPMLDLKMIMRNPKFFAGYSDITALHIAINQFCHFETYHTPMPATELYEGIDDYSSYYLNKMLYYDVKGEYKNPDDKAMVGLVEGVGEGTLIGGNLSLVVASLGTPYEINTKGKILFLEDIGENIYRIDSMMTQLRNAGKLKDCNGILLGQWTNCKYPKDQDSLTLKEVFDEVIIPTGKPCIMDVACGHTMPSMSLPLGSYVRIDALNKSIDVIS